MDFWATWTAIHSKLPRPSDEAEAEIWGFIMLENSNKPGTWMWLDSEKNFHTGTAKEFAEHIKQDGIDLENNSAWKSLTTQEAIADRARRRQMYEAAIGAFINSMR